MSSHFLPDFRTDILEGWKKLTTGMRNWSIIKDCPRVPWKIIHGRPRPSRDNQVDCEIAIGGCSDWSQEYRDFSNGVLWCYLCKSASEINSTLCSKYSSPMPVAGLSPLHRQGSSVCDWTFSSDVPILLYSYARVPYYHPHILPSVGWLMTEPRNIRDWTNRDWNRIWKRSRSREKETEISSYSSWAE